MKRPAIFFDRDNTLIACDDYLGDPDRVMLVKGAADAVAKLRAMGFAIVVVSNQSGVARGMFDEAAVQAVNQRLELQMAAEHAGAIIDRHEYCPYHPEGTVEEYRHESERRKPKPGMILEAARALALDLSRSWLIGDAARDIEAGTAAGVRTILFEDPSLSASPAAANNHQAGAEFTVKALAEAVEVIRKHLPPPSETPTPPPAVAAPVKMTIPQRPAEPRPLDLKPLEHLAEQILREMRMQHEAPQNDFSVPKLLAGIVQMIALATIFFAYLFRESPTASLILLTAIFLQTLTISLLVMGRK
jgi:D-glycero-D-manno-heptose 1,7-bisphosphate phosphatase